MSIDAAKRALASSLLNRLTASDPAVPVETLFSGLRAEGLSRPDLEAALFALNDAALVRVEERVYRSPPGDSEVAKLPEGVFFTPPSKPPPPNEHRYQVVCPLPALRGWWTGQDQRPPAEIVRAGEEAHEFFATTQESWLAYLERREQERRGPPQGAGAMSDDPIRNLKAQAAQERQREIAPQRQELRWQVDGQDYDISDLQYYGERAGNACSTRGLAKQIAGFLSSVRAAGWWDRFEALLSNDDPAWTVALDIYRRCGEGDIDGATAKLDEADTIGQSWARNRLTDALQRKIPDAIVSGKTEQAEGTGAPRDQNGEGQAAEGATTKRGRKSHCDRQKDREIADGWVRAKGAGTRKKDYARDRKVSLKDLNRILDRHARRVRRAQK
jgi:hypothetical protein